MSLYTCPCGQDHRGSAHWSTVQEMIDRLGATIRVVIGENVYEVPRIYIAVHGIIGHEVPGLAKQYGWTVQAKG
jgi:hypothetical protein